LYYGYGDEAWKRAIDNELRKMAGYRGSKPLRPSTLIFAEPKTGDKEDLIEMEEPGLIDGLAWPCRVSDRQNPYGRDCSTRSDR